MDSGSCGQMMTTCKYAIAVRKSVSVKCRLMVKCRLQIRGKMCICSLCFTLTGI